MGHELRIWEDHFVCACFAVDEDIHLYTSFDLEMEGSLASPLAGWKIDLQDVHGILDNWSK